MFTKKSIVHSLVAALSLAVSFGAVADTSPALSAEITRSGGEVYFVSSPTHPVSGIQFDIKPVGRSLFSEAMLDGCVSGIPSTHRGDCSLRGDGTIRVLVFSFENSELPSGLISRFPPSRFEIVAGSVVGASPAAREVAVEVVQEPNDASALRAR